MNVPEAFRQRIRSHNRHAVVMSLMCLLGAWCGWLLAYGLVVGLTLGFLTVGSGQEVILGEKLQALPWWMNPAAGLAGGVLICWAAWDARLKRFKPVDDRPIVGSHIFLDIMLAPARMTLSVWEHLAGVIRLDWNEQAEAFELLRYISENRKCTSSHLGAWMSDLSRLRKLLAALQLAGWVDLHRGDGDGFYIVRSDEADEVEAMVTVPCEEATET